MGTQIDLAATVEEAGCPLYASVSPEKCVGEKHNSLWVEEMKANVLRQFSLGQNHNNASYRGGSLSSRPLLITGCLRKALGAVLKPWRAHRLPFLLLELLPNGRVERAVRQDRHRHALHAHARTHEALLLHSGLPGATLGKAVEASEQDASCQPSPDRHLR